MTDEEKNKIEPDFNRALDLREEQPYEAIVILKKLDKEFPNQAIIIGTLGGIYFTYLKDCTSALPYFQKTVSISLFHTLQYWAI